ncbi:SET domain-containing protein [Polynucleobacter kasalickyi]|uniref:SET domain-containing protein-lysine N-methyltransferase n=1 Tax=Polynucleobacter kasalickyi TaxID=1938817 RepID=A0A1W2BSG9_9BURK|nr:SET domain-containing protein-lysine N-methyltransferase [Polynucleobacter kasalickyi]SMC75684.1 hypothetical protein SAMN06296008_11529 [Polynucleobacter kasalickyi]
MSKKFPESLSSDSIEVRDSTIHGRGVYSTKKIKKNDCIVEYLGQRISWKEALKRHPHDPLQPFHTFYFSLTNGKVIDGNVNGNIAKWINHSCKPNCETKEIKDKNNKLRVFIFAKRNINKDDELFYDYGLELDAEHTKEEQLNYKCLCGKKNCRKTMLANK